MKVSETDQNAFGLSEPDLSRARELLARIRVLQTELDAVLGRANPQNSLELHDRGIGPAQAADLRARLKSFAEDWERPEAAIYDKSPAG